jgi:hypothetical protein
VVVVSVVVVWVRVLVFRGCNLTGCKVARLQVYRQSKRIFALVLLGFDIAFIGCFCTIGMVYRSRDGGGGAVVVWCGGGVGGVVVPVVGRGWQAVPPSSSV